MDLNLADDVAVVIGGAAGIGHAIAVAFAAEGARVMVADRNAAVVDVARCSDDAADAATPGQLVGQVVDATDQTGVQRLAAEVDRRWGRCDHVVYAAGGGSGKYGFPFWNLEPSDWEPVWRVNMLGAVHAAHAFRHALIASGRGSLLLLSSIAGQIGSQTDPPYSAAKAALLNFSQCAAKDFAAYNVRVNTICPGMVQTAINRAVWQAWHDQQAPGDRLSYEEWAGAKVKQVAPLARWQQPEDVAALAVFLASRRAENITGQTLNVDGGQVMHW